MQLSSEAKVGITVLISLFLLGSMVLALSRIDLRPSSGTELIVNYQTVDGLREGAPVRYAGVNVGKVEYIHLMSQGVEVGLRLDRDLPVPVDSKFVIASAGVLGDKH